MRMKVANNLAEIFSLLLSEHQDEFSKPALLRTGLKKQKDLNYACGIQIYKEMFKSSLCGHQTRWRLHHSLTLKQIGLYPYDSSSIVFVICSDRPLFSAWLSVLFLILSILLSRLNWRLLTP